MRTFISFRVTDIPGLCHCLPTHLAALCLAAWLACVCGFSPPSLLAQDDAPASADGDPADKTDAAGRPETAAEDQPPEAPPTVDADDDQQTDNDTQTIVSDVRVSSFQDVTPGETTVAEVKRLFGQPVDQQERGDQSTLIYEIGPFPRIEFLARLDIVNSIVIHLAQPAESKDVARELDLAKFTPVTVRSEAGEPLGQAFPERGVVFSFSPDDPQPRVSQLMLEPISAESFVLRASSNEGPYRRRLADLEYALQLDPQHAPAHWHRARILAASGQAEPALEAARAAVEQEPADPRFRLTRAALLFELDEYEQAVKETERVLSQESLSKVVRARAECQLGDLLAARRDFQEAIQHHLAAVESATALANSQQADERREAKRVLIDAHLAIAQDITQGNWSGKADAAPKWLRNANELVNDSIENEGADESLKLLMLRQALASYVGMRGAVDPKEVVDKTLQLGERLIEQAEDSLRKSEFRWQLVQAVFDAVRIEQARGDVDKVLAYAERGVELLEELGHDTPDTPHANYLAGRLLFYLGSTHAIRKDDHDEAVRWYEKALPYLSQDLPAVYSSERGLHGERFVSMGVSYWQVDVREEAIRLTSDGLELMQQAHQEGTLEKNALAVPYNNLSSMYKAVGRAREAEALAKKADELEQR